MNSDMTKYCYQHFENAYNIGWNVNFDSTVESKETFNSIFIEKLTSYCENPLNSDLNGVCRETEIDGTWCCEWFCSWRTDFSAASI